MGLLGSDTQAAGAGAVKDNSGSNRRAPHDGDRYFARGRLRWLRKRLDELGERPAAMLDFGCSDSATSADFFAQLSIRSLVGVDVSATGNAAIEPAGVDDPKTFVHVADYRATGSMDLAFTHDIIPRMSPRNRAAATVLVFRSLKSGGLFAYWDHNPWNPVSRLTSSASSGRTSSLTPTDARRLLRGVGFDIVHTTSTFYFPRTLTWCHPLEPMLGSLPLGRQYMVLARRP